MWRHRCHYKHTGRVINGHIALGTGTVVLENDICWHFPAASFATSDTAEASMRQVCDKYATRASAIVKEMIKEMIIFYYGQELLVTRILKW